MQIQDSRDKMSKSQMTAGLIGVVAVITLAYAFYKNINNNKK